MLSKNKRKVAYMKTSGQRIKEERTALGWSQQRLADEISKIKKERITRAAVAFWETGDSKTQKPENLFAVAEAMNIRPKWLLDGIGEKFAGAKKTPLVSPGDSRLPIKRALFKLSAGVSGYEIEYKNGESNPIFMSHK